MPGSVTFAPNPNKKRKKSDKTYTHRKDTRSENNAGKYPNYGTIRTRSGHSITVDDNAGTESITVQHRSGSAIQFHPDGGVSYTTHNGKYEVVFGEDRITVSGAQDITVKGDASLRVYGDYNVTCHNDYNLTVMGDFNVTSKNHNRLIRGNIDTIAKNETKKVEGSSSGTYGGGYARASEASASVISRGGTGYFGAGSGVAIEKAGQTKDGSLTVTNRKGDSVHQNDDGKRAVNVTSNGRKVYQVADSGKYSLSADDNTNIETQKAFKLKTQQDIGMQSQTGGIQVQAQTGNIQVKAQAGNLQVKAGGKAQLRGEAGTVVDGAGPVNVASSGGLVSILGAAGGVALDGSQVSLNSGIGSLISQVTGLQFNLPGILDQIQLPSMSSPGAQPSISEPEADTWTSKLA